jgi:hypothetical protein
MKKLIAGMVAMGIGLAGVCGFMVGQGVNAVEQVQAQQVQQPFMQVEEVAVKSSVEPYMYVVTEVYGDEINGLSITHKTPDNGGVVLSKEYNNVPDVQTGDVVLVEYGVAFDDVVSVKVVDNDDLPYELIEEEMPHQVKNADGERFFLSEDGSYVGESFYY